MLEGLVQWMYNIVQNFGSIIISLLPTSPFRSFIDGFVAPEYLGWLNWFFPISTIISILGVWLVSVGMFYLYSIVMRWIKMIGD